MFCFNCLGETVFVLWIIMDLSMYFFTRRRIKLITKSSLKYPIASYSILFSNTVMCLHTTRYWQKEGITSFLLPRDDWKNCPWSESNNWRFEFVVEFVEVLINYSDIGKCDTKCWISVEIFQISTCNNNVH